MTWKYIKDKILVWGEDDYVFADAFVSIVHELDSSIEKMDLVQNTLKMLEELMIEGLIDVFILIKENNEIIDVVPCNIFDENDIFKFVKNVKEEWKQLGYSFPKPDQLFWTTTNEKGLQLI